MATPQGKTSVNSKPVVQAQPVKPGGAAPAPVTSKPATPALPELDLSHLSEEERRQIQAVLDRQKQEEEREAKLIRLVYL